MTGPPKFDARRLRTTNPRVEFESRVLHEADWVPFGDFALSEPRAGYRDVTRLLLREGWQVTRSGYTGSGSGKALKRRPSPPGSNPAVPTRDRPSASKQPISTTCGATISSSIRQLTSSGRHCSCYQRLRLLRLSIGPGIVIPKPQIQKCLPTHPVRERARD